MNMVIRIYRHLYAAGIKIWNRVTGLLTYDLVLSVGQACNLKCVNCANFCPISLPETRRYPLSDVIESLRVVLDCSWHIGQLQIQGGSRFCIVN